MSVSIAVIESTQNLPAALGLDLTAAVDLAKAEKALSTRKAYATDFRLFKAWCEAKGVSSLPASPETVAAFLAAETGNGTKPSTTAWLPHVSGGQGRFDLQDDGRFAPQIGRHSTRLCARCRVVQGSCRRGVAVSIGPAHVPLIAQQTQVGRVVPKPEVETV